MFTKFMNAPTGAEEGTKLAVTETTPVSFPKERLQDILCTVLSDVYEKNEFEDGDHFENWLHWELGIRLEEIEELKKCHSFPRCTPALTAKDYEFSHAFN